MGLYPKNLNEYVASMGIPRGPKSKAFLVDPVNGSDTNPGTTWLAPLKSLEAAEALCTANQHDTVLFLAGATADNPTAEITWDKSYTHLIGIGSEVYGVGQRCRVVASSASIHNTITFSGNGCIVKNMQFNNEHASGAAVGIALVTGQRNFFEKVFFMCPTSQDANSYSLKITDGGENVFKDCTIGQHTLVRNAASFGLWIAKGAGEANPTRNKFLHCEFLSWSGSANHVLVKVATDVDVEAFTIQFEDCLFSNINGGSLLTAAIVDGATETHHRIYLRGSNNCVDGCTAVANPLTYVYTPDVEDAVSGLIMIAVAES
jgi:hypothetical protein